jgi:ATP-dependent helicase/nuclease subunit B
MYKKYLKDNTCFIVPASIKKEILSYISSNKLLLNVSFYTMSELKKNIFFDYDEKTIYSLAKSYNLKYDDAVLMIQNIYYLNDSFNDDFKIKQLKEMKDYLEKNYLLFHNENFLPFLKNKNIVTTYGKTSFFNEKILNLFDNVIYLNKINKSKKNIYEFNFVEDEIDYVAHKIADLIDNGIDINKIKLVNVSNEYAGIIEKIFLLYNLPVNLKKRTSLYDLNIIKNFIEILKNNSLNDSLILFKEKYDLNISTNLDIYNKIIEVMNKYYFLSDYSKDIEFVIKGFKNTFIKEKSRNNVIECIAVEEIFDDENFYFLIGFNNHFPSFYKDEDYISDTTKVKLEFKTSSLINKYIKEYYICKINNTKNIFISYKLKDYFNSYLVSTLVDEINGDVIKNPNLDNMFSYSKKFDQIKLSKYLDEFYKFSYINKNLGILYNTYGKDRYDSYDNSFKGINDNKYMLMKNNNVSLSYSSLDEFYKCSFRYYLNNILNENEDTFAIYVGNLYHQILSKIYEDDFNFETIYNECLKEREISNKEAILLIKLKEELKKNICLLHEQLKNSNFKKAICEKKIEIKLKSKVSVILKGFIDKIMISEDGKYGYVVDYKTGKPKIDFENLKDGLNMQLAIYMYLMNKSKDYADVFLVGCYLQKILDDDINKEELKLDGYTYNDLNAIKLIDNNCYDKSFISGIKVKKNGSLSDNKKLFDSAYYEEILFTVEQKIEDAINCITAADFKINPKVIKGENISCKFCNYKDICYRKYKDSIIISQAGDENE